MKIIYIHHGNRELGNPPSKDDDLTEIGYEDARLNNKLFKNVSVKAVYTSPYFRCRRTAEIIFAGKNIPIYEDERLNEYGKWNKNVEGETWTQLQERIMASVKDIVFRYNDEDIVAVVTSGVNVVGFLNLAYKLKPSETAPFVMIPSCSPMTFDIDKSCFE